MLPKTASGIGENAGPHVKRQRNVSLNIKTPFEGADEFKVLTQVGDLPNVKVVSRSEIEVFGSAFLSGFSHRSDWRNIGCFHEKADGNN